MVRVRLNLIAYVMLTMAVFWGAFGSTRAWLFPIFLQFAIFAVLVIVWSIASIAVMTFTGRVKAANQLKEEILERQREDEALAVEPGPPLHSVLREVQHTDSDYAVDGKHPDLLKGRRLEVPELSFDVPLTDDELVVEDRLDAHRIVQPKVSE